VQPAPLRDVVRLDDLLGRKVEQPKARIFPWRTRSVSTDRVSSMSVVASGRCTW
jgi:hypothetical protein